MTCTHCCRAKVGECNCEEFVVVAMDNGERVEIFKITYAELHKYQNLGIDAGEMHCYPLESLPVRTAEYMGEFLTS